MDAFDTLGIARRSGIVKIRDRRFRVTEPEPLAASVILTHVMRYASPIFARLYRGDFALTRPSVCPKCGAEGKEKVNGERWLCQEPVPDGQASRPCGTLWPREVQLREDGKPDIMTLDRALQDRSWRALIAHEIRQTIDGLDPDTAHALALRMIYGGTEIESVPGHWSPVPDGRALGPALAAAGIGGMGVLRLAKAHLETWALPSLVDDWTDTSPASPTSKTGGDLETREPEPPPHAPGGRVPPRTQKRKG
jgi:hypothetical protein